MFWFSDGGWPTNTSRLASFRNTTSTEALDVARELGLATLPGNGTSPATPFQSAPTTSASIHDLVEKLVGFLLPVSETSNISNSDPLTASLFKSLYYGLGIQSVDIPESQTDDVNITLSLMKLNPPSNPSLLSEVSFLRNLTRHAAVNDTIINIAEGYIITILVVVCFILIFLIREWVVQQQPGINMGAGFNAEFAAGGLARDPQPIANLRPPRRNAGVDNAPVREDDQNQNDQDAPRERIIARPRGRFAVAQNNEEDPDLQLPNPEGRSSEESSRPSPPRDALATASEIHRGLEEEPRHTEEFLNIWRRADSDPDEVLRIIEDENKGEDMRYWVNAMNVLQVPRLRGNGVPSPGSSHVDPVPESKSNKTSQLDGAVQTENGGSSTSSESWVDIKQPSGPLQPSPTEKDTSSFDFNSAEDLDHSVKGKGKGKASEDFNAARVALRASTNLSHNTGLPAGPSKELTSEPISPRPRAVSDGPLRKENISRLANNNWSFSNLSEDGSQTAQAGDSVAASLPDEGPNVDSDSELIPLRQFLGSSEPSFVDSPSQPTVLNADRLSEMTSGEVAKGENGPCTITGKDGVVRTYPNLQQAFAENPFESDSEDGAEDHNEAPQINPFRPDTPLPEPHEPLLPPNADNPPAEPQVPPIAPPAVPQGFQARVADFLWGGVGDDQWEEQGGNDERIVQDIADEAPFVPVAHEDPFDQPEPQFPEQDREVVEAAIAAGIDPNDQDAIDDAEDFEGIMELIGMRGPIFSLVQNALFSAFLLSLTVAFGIWIPYNIGRISLLALGNPGSTLKIPLRIAYGFAALLQDLSLSIMGMISYLLVSLFSWTFGLFFSTANGDAVQGLGSAAMKLSQNSAERIMNDTVHSLVHIADSEIFVFSAASHDSLITLKTFITDAVAGLGATVRFLLTGNYSLTHEVVQSAAVNYLTQGWHLLASIPSYLARPDAWVISLEVPKRNVPLNLELGIWNGWDRFWAIFGGYSALFLLGAVYVKKGSPFSTNQQGREWEASIIDLLNQAGGVIKVILIISIEMLVFPLYCGLLLDGALLPLFDNATIMSRILFTIKSPFTSLFVHWFVGTCYMFHFALFVSMCRKIMRKGVLCKFHQSPNLKKYTNQPRLHPRP